MITHTIKSPDCLLNIDRPPQQLYTVGNLETARRVAIVGSRNCSQEGSHIAKSLASELARNAIDVVSGLARGIDIAAHLGAIEAKGRTIAVIPSGINNIYPRSHTNYARTIVGSGGAIISEQAGSYSPKKHDFLKRNRLIAGLSEAVIVVEAAARSGALNTARHALEQGKEVIAVPGSILSPYAKGTNDLIRQGASVLTEVNDLYSLLNIERKEPQQLVHLNPTEKNLVALINQGNNSVDRLIGKGNLAVDELQQMITKLEIEGVLIRGAGNNVYIK